VIYVAQGEFVARGALAYAQLDAGQAAGLPSAAACALGAGACAAGLRRRVGSTLALPRLLGETIGFRLR
jgi:hypothetical protein